MKIGIPKEIKNNENRVAMTPADVYGFVKAGHQVIVEAAAGEGAGFSDRQYEEAGGIIVSSPAETWKAEMVMKVKEPVPSEYHYFREGLILFTFLHLAAEPELTKALLKSKVTAIAYETVQLNNGTLPLLAPMSEVAGRMAAQIGAQYLERHRGGKGILLGGVPGVHRGKVAIIGGGMAGTNAAKIAAGLGAEVRILDINAVRLRQIEDIFGGRVRTLMSNPGHISESVVWADLVIGAVLIPGAKAPKLVAEEMVKRMEKGSVIIDIAIDQGGIFETADRVTTHEHPVYEKYGVLHYAVANMPGAVPRTSAQALANVTCPYALKIANNGLMKALKDDQALKSGLNTFGGFVTIPAVAAEGNFPYKKADECLL
ncbi:alanine dehydrogenase [Bacillus sp. FJAT-42376]|uniref:alanine dehydrogenase n=1 Tax=Bacillus sp. FJAT-42376 TaxID=2014076 RepID=UPI000F4E3BDA|nr:alanine dehydrogenase [Bacillus sp. FJAT-42376]AZB43922.1 alanine dehydrogenase [Bacillus sp. FJAT-42376]